MMRLKPYLLVECVITVLGLFKSIYIEIFVCVLVGSILGFCCLLALVFYPR